MQVLRLGPRSLRPLRYSAVRCVVTTASAVDISASTSSAPTAIPLGRVEALWDTISVEEKAALRSQLAEIQKKDWKQLSIDEKKAAYFVSFGPHGHRAPASKPGDNLKIAASVAGLLGVSYLLMLGVKAMAPAPPKTITKEWQEASNERAIEQKMNPITGITSKGYKGAGFVQNN
ncbi:COX4, subunit IV of cytochrome c oxidase [Guyanagaster necrorhizus]|uniref:COX4, subunit IV of cytochrome c oxidase n=1 Tax=Guyanagaster necrorhizus TaxID=856835 RepID=A0A9P7VJY9_9AGAR|nr:COX4, subunit IV of cytochrome c oxidase [Guyanagaster necrorhizus MCA 3950]KAG7442516.1 COX4, subunit IV of cytochrome c oxidase [Guyanagaster necrorhizus MCA 3950]